MRLIIAALLLLSASLFAQGPQVVIPIASTAQLPSTCGGSAIAWLLSPTGVFYTCVNGTPTIYAGFAAQAANTIVGNYTGGSAAPTAGAAPAGGTSGCAGATDAATYTAGTGWGCHQIGGGASGTGFQSSAVTTNIGATNIVASASDTYGYQLNWTVHVTTAGTSCTGATTVNLNFIWQDPNAAGTHTLTYPLTLNAAGSQGTIDALKGTTEYILAKTGTAVQFSTDTYTAGAACSPAPAYQITGSLIAPAG